MIKKAFVVMALCTLAIGPAFAGEHDCCAKDGATTASNKKQCASFAALNLSANQKAKLTAWQDECLKAGCTEQSKAKFLQQARSILNDEQFAALKKECDAHMGKAS